MSVAGFESSQRCFLLCSSLFMFVLHPDRQPRSDVWWCKGQASFLGAVIGLLQTAARCCTSSSCLLAAPEWSQMSLLIVAVGAYVLFFIWIFGPELSILGPAPSQTLNLFNRCSCSFWRTDRQPRWGVGSCNRGQAWSLGALNGLLQIVVRCSKSCSCLLAPIE